MDFSELRGFFQLSRLAGRQMRATRYELTRYVSTRGLGVHLALSDRGLGVVRSWTWRGQIVHLAWSDRGLDVVRSWTFRGQIVDLAWSDRGLRVVRTCTWRGQIVDFIVST